MKRLSLALGVVLFFTHALYAQSPRELRGTVVVLDANENEVGVLRGTTVILEETQGSDVTNNNGAFRLPIPALFRGGDRITLRIDAPGYAIYRPVGGKTRIPADLIRDQITIRLLPKGSIQLLSGPAIQLLIAQAAEEAAPPRSHEEEEELDLSRSIKEWAIAYGFSAEQVLLEVERWVAEAQARSGDIYVLGLAAFAEKQFAQASDLFAQSAVQHEKSLEQIEVRQRRLEEDRQDARRKIVRDRRLEGNAHYLRRQYTEAFEAYQKALAFVNRREEPALWAAVQRDIGSAKWARASWEAEGKHIWHLLTEATQAYRRALEVFTRETMPYEWAGTQNDLANALRDQALRSNVDDARRQLEETIHLYRQSLRTFTPETMPNEWAGTQHNLANALGDLAMRSTGDVKRQLLVEAIQAYHKALQIRTREAWPREWALTLHNLALTLRDLAINSNGEKAHLLLTEASKAYRQVLQVFTRDAFPQDWAMTQNNLANALRYLAIYSGVNEALRLLAEAIQAYRLALQIYTRNLLPQDWAMTQSNLAEALRERALRSNKDEAHHLFAEAIHAYWQALQVYTREALPQNWAITQRHLAQALHEQALRSSGSEASRYWALATAHADSAYSVLRNQSLYAAPARFSLEKLRQPFLEGHIHFRRNSWRDAVTAYRDVLRVFPDSLQGYIYVAAAFREAAVPDSAIAAYREALSVDPEYDPAMDALAWQNAMLNDNLDEATELSLRSLELDPRNAGYWNTLAEVYLRAGLYDQARAANEQALAYARNETLVNAIRERAAKLEDIGHR